MNFITDWNSQTEEKKKRKKEREREMDRVKIENTANSILPKPQYA